MSETLGKIQTEVQQVAAIISMVSPLTGQIIQLGTAGFAAAKAIREMLGNVAKNPDGTPLTDADFEAHFAAAETATTKVVETADAALAEDAALLDKARSTGT